MLGHTVSLERCRESYTLPPPKLLAVRAPTRTPDLPDHERIQADAFRMDTCAVRACQRRPDERNGEGTGS
jgi:hypothetical protein